MTSQKRKPEEESAGPAGGSKKPSVRVIPGEKSADSLKRRPPKIRVVTSEEGESEERLTLTELKKRFAGNLDSLLKIIGLNRKQAAREIGVAEKLMRRLASAGVSFVEERNAENLSMIADYFALPGVDHLWRVNLVRRLLTTEDGEGFVEKFRNRLLAERERRLAAARVVGEEEMTLVGRALGVEDAEQPPLIGPNADKVAAILASPKADTFQRVIDDYYELVRRHVSDPDEDRRAARSARV